MAKIKAIAYERIEQKKEIEKELFGKLTPKERKLVAKNWMALTSMFAKQGEAQRATAVKKAKKKK